MSTQFDTDDRFDNPASAVALDLAELNGRLLLIKPAWVEKDINTTLGPKDATVATVTVLDGDMPGRTFTEAFIWPRVLQAQLKSGVATGRYCLGRLGQGVAKPGQNAPWKLADPTDADRRMAREHLAAAARPEDDEAPF